MPKYTFEVWDDPDHAGRVKFTVTPPIDQATAAQHIAQLKVDGKGLGEAFGYATAILDAVLRRHKGIPAGHAARPSILWTPDSGGLS